MDRSEASALADLQMHWDEAYVITLDGHIWCARYRASAEELRAHTSSELRELIRSDYGYRQKADLVAYDPDGDTDDGEDGHDGEDGDDVAVGDGAAADQGAEGDDEGGADEAGAPPAPARGAERRGAGAGDFATIRGERMSI